MTPNTINTLTQALTMEVEGLCGAERRLADFIPRLARAAVSSSLRDAFAVHAYYEIAAYSNAQELADFLGMTDVSRVLTRILDEEYAASERLRDVCDQVTRDALEDVAA